MLQQVEVLKTFSYVYLHLDTYKISFISHTRALYPRMIHNNGLQHRVDLFYALASQTQLLSSTAFCSEVSSTYDAGDGNVGIHYGCLDP